MEHRRLGGTDVEILRVVLGCGNFGGVGSAPEFFGRGESDEEARAVVASILAEGYRGTGFDQLLVGSADTVVRSLRSYRTMGFDYVMVRHIVGDHQLMLRSFERIGRDVMPRIRDL